MKELHPDCGCGDSLVIPRTHALRYITGGTLLLLGTFLGGYFWATHQGQDTYCTQAEQESFSDALEYSLMKHFKGELALEESPAEEGTDDTASHIETMLSQAQQLATEQKEVAEKVSVSSPSAPLALDQSSSEDEAAKNYYGLVMGGTKKSVLAFIEKMSKQGIMLELKERTSRNKQGKTSVWYQAVTQGYRNRNDLEITVALLKKHGKLNNNISIVHC